MNSFRYILVCDTKGDILVWTQSWDIRCYYIGKTIVLKTKDAVAIKESKYSEAGCLITLCYFQNNSPGSIFSLVCYWAVNSILYRVNLIHSGINLQCIKTW